MQQPQIFIILLATICRGIIPIRSIIFAKEEMQPFSQLVNIKLSSKPDSFNFYSGMMARFPMNFNPLHPNRTAQVVIYASSTVTILLCIFTKSKGPHYELRSKGLHYKLTINVYTECTKFSSMRNLCWLYWPWQIDLYEVHPTPS